MCVDCSFVCSVILKKRRELLQHVQLTENDFFDHSEIFDPTIPRLPVAPVIHEEKHEEEKKHEGWIVNCRFVDIEPEVKLPELPGVELHEPEEKVAVVPPPRPSTPKMSSGEAGAIDHRDPHWHRLGQVFKRMFDDNDGDGQDEEQSSKNQKGATRSSRLSDQAKRAMSVSRASETSKTGNPTPSARVKFRDHFPNYQELLKKLERYAKNYTNFTVLANDDPASTSQDRLCYIDRPNHPFNLLSIFSYRHLLGVDTSVVEIQRKLKYYYDIRMARSIEEMERVDGLADEDTSNDAFAALESIPMQFPVPQLVYKMKAEEFKADTLYKFVFLHLRNQVNRADNEFRERCANFMKRDLKFKVRAMADANCRLANDRAYADLEQVSCSLLEARQDAAETGANLPTAALLGPACEYKSFETACADDSERLFVRMTHQLQTKVLTTCTGHRDATLEHRTHVAKEIARVQGVLDKLHRKWDSAIPDYESVWRVSVSMRVMCCV